MESSTPYKPTNRRTRKFPHQSAGALLFQFRSISLSTVYKYHTPGIVPCSHSPHTGTKDSLASCQPLIALYSCNGQYCIRVGYPVFVFILNVNVLSEACLSYYNTVPAPVMHSKRGTPNTPLRV